MWGLKTMSLSLHAGYSHEDHQKYVKNESVVLQQHPKHAF
jgi:hypothetical protein